MKFNVFGDKERIWTTKEVNYLILDDIQTQVTTTQTHIHVPNFQRLATVKNLRRHPRSTRTYVRLLRYPNTFVSFSVKKST